MKVYQVIFNLLTKCLCDVDGISENEVASVAKNTPFRICNEKWQKI